MYEDQVREVAVEPTLRVKLPAFEGPLDLLLHLIKKNRLNIYDIPIACITEDYLRSLDAMGPLNMESAGHFLEMAATLALIKSRLLIPDLQTDEEVDEDPRLQVVRPLLLYACMRQAAIHLNRRPWLGIDQYTHGRVGSWLEEICDEHPTDPRPLEVDLYDLVKAYSRLHQRSLQLQSYQVTAERLSVTERIQELFDLLTRTGEQRFRQLCVETPEREVLVVTFLALLEMIKRRLVRVWEEPADHELRVAVINDDEVGAYGKSGP
jgi:segregation and condensation protein A